MRRFNLRIGGTTFHVTTETILVACGLICAIVLMASFVSTLRVAVHRGEILRAAQRAGSLGETALARTATSHTQAFGPTMTPTVAAGIGRGLRVAVTSRP